VRLVVRWQGGVNCVQLYRFNKPLPALPREGLRPRGCEATATVKKKREGVDGTRPELALCAKAGIAINRPFCYFCGYDKSNGPLWPRAHEVSSSAQH
jgi:hypothetical protein